MRKPISRDELAKAVAELEEAGQTVTNRAVRAKVGGSPKTISNYLNECREANARTARLLVNDLSKEYLDSLAKELDRHGARGQKEMQELLKTLQTDVDQLSEALEQAEEKAGQAEAEAISLRKELDDRKQQQSMEVADLRGRLQATQEQLTLAEAARDIAIRAHEADRVGIQRALASLSDCEARLSTTQAEVTRLGEELGMVREDRATLRQQTTDFMAIVAELRGREASLGEQLLEARREEKELRRRLDETMTAKAEAEQQAAVTKAKLVRQNRPANPGRKTINKLKGDGKGGNASAVAKP